MKDEMLNKARRMGIPIEVTPSLEPIMDEIPINLQRKINRLYASGLSGKVRKVIQKALQSEDIPVLAEYMKEKNRLRRYKGSLITTHRYLLSMDDTRLDNFDCVIVDEDIIFKSVISNQGEITVSELKRLRDTISDNQVRAKISYILDRAKVQSCIFSKGFKWEYKDGILRMLQVDIPAFCSAEFFTIAEQILIPAFQRTQYHSLSLHICLKEST